MAKLPAKKKRKRPGQPTKYDPKYCEMLIEHRSKGFSFESFAAVIGTHRATLYEWAKVHPEFSDARNIAKELCLMYFEQIAKDAMEGKIEKFPIALWVFSMKNKFNWSDKKEDDDGKKKFEPIVIDLPNAGRTIEIGNKNEK